MRGRMYANIQTSKLGVRNKFILFLYIRVRAHVCTHRHTYRYRHTSACKCLRTHKHTPVPYISTHTFMYITKQTVTQLTAVMHACIRKCTRSRMHAHTLTVLYYPYKIISSQHEIYFLYKIISCPYKIL